MPRNKSKNNSISPKILARFEDAQNILLMAHHNPDGDALGSIVGLALALRGQGKNAALHLTGSRQDSLEFLLEGQVVLSEVKDLAPYDLMALLDCHGFDRLGPSAGPAMEALVNAQDAPPPLVVIDHHLVNENEAGLPVWIWDPHASSTGELVVRLLNALEWDYSAEAAEALLLAIASDTGFFSQTNATPGALRAAADLVAAGGSMERVDRRIRKDWHIRRLRLMGLALNALELHCDDQVAVTAVTPAMLEAAQAEMSDTEDLVEMGRALSGVRMSALIKDYGKGPGTVRVSLRSRDGANARALAKTFGGGGHREASAYNDPVADGADMAKKHFLAEVEKYL